ncbi:Putative sulfate transporter ychM [Serratia fonticola]|uniref:Sulfate transporter ychM n=1 Tax=Serratia fonticola TaxID=47917 RepID=A0A4U9UYY3_SERFO|nr:Putative sulfate transporter ychM [Serratia fonticola]
MSHYSALPLFSVSGPAAGLVTIVTSAIVSLGDFPTFLFALLLSGIFQFVFGMLRSGKLAALIPSAVIHGMLAGIGILLILQQLPLAMGYPVGHGLSEEITLQQLQGRHYPGSHNSQHRGATAYQILGGALLLSSACGFPHYRAL